MGAVELEAGEGRLVLTVPSGLHGAEITLRFPSVGAPRRFCWPLPVPEAEPSCGGRPGNRRSRPCRFSEPVRRLHRGGGQLHDPHRRAAGAFRVLFFAPARPHFCFHAGLRLCGGGRPVELTGCAPVLYAPVLEILGQMGCRVEPAGDTVRISRFGRLHGAGRVFTGAIRPLPPMLPRCWRRQCSVPTARAASRT